MLPMSTLPGCCAPNTTVHAAKVHPRTVFCLAVEETQGAKEDVDDGAKDNANLVMSVSWNRSD